VASPQEKPKEKEFQMKSFCPVTCSMKALTRRIKRMEKKGDAEEVQFLKGVKYARIVLVECA
jgi:hypothetical protein